MDHQSLDDLPDVLTIPEAAEFMRVSPGVAYEMARRYRATSGREGLPVFMAGERMMRVAKLDLVRYMAGTLNGGGRPHRLSGSDLTLGPAALAAAVGRSDRVGGARVCRGRAPSSPRRATPCPTDRYAARRRAPASRRTRSLGRSAGWLPSGSSLRHESDREPTVASDREPLPTHPPTERLRPSHRTRAAVACRSRSEAPDSGVNLRQLACSPT